MAKRRAPKRTRNPRLIPGAQAVVTLNGETRFVRVGAVRADHFMVWVPGEIGWHGIPMADLQWVKGSAHV
jgi:hypothetical protein